MFAGDRLQGLRKEYGLTYSDMVCALSRLTRDKLNIKIIMDWESGKRQPNDDQYRAIVQFFCKPYSYFGK